MQIPVEITFDDLPSSEWVEDYVRERVDRLDKMCNNLTGCRVVIERAQHHHRTGNPFRVRIEVTMPPRKEMVADKQGTVSDTHVELRPVIRRAFEAMEKQIKKQTAMRNGDVKHHEEPRALVVRVFQDADYGFIKSPIDGQEYYFHRNAVLHGDFDRLTPGTEVRFEPALDMEELQASTVQVVGKPGNRVIEGDETIEPPDGWRTEDFS